MPGKDVRDSLTPAVRQRIEKRINKIDFSRLLKSRSLGVGVKAVMNMAEKGQEVINNIENFPE
jgi:hypothetical protein